MTPREAFSLEACPECGDRLMKVPSTGLVSCLAWLRFVDCKWHLRFPPVRFKASREEPTKREQRLLDQQAEIYRRIQEWT